MNIIRIYTDGSCLNNPGPGGWAAILKFNDNIKELSGGSKHSTNNRMELSAVIEALKSLKTNKYPVEVYSDSKYVVDAIEKGWVFNWAKSKNFAGKANEDLWREFLKLYANFTIKFNWIRGHNGHPENERCDVLATTEALKFK